MTHKLIIASAMKREDAKSRNLQDLIVMRYVFSDPAGQIIQKTIALW
jgi:hypothetical protein